MALEESFTSLSRHLCLLHDELQELRRTVIEKPPKGDVVLVDLFSDAADDLLGWMVEASAAASEGEESTSYPVDLDRARRSLKMCQEKFILMSVRLSSDLLSYDRMEELVSFGDRRRGGWEKWAANVKAALESCREPLYDVNQTLFTCWQELTERVGTTSVSVQATNIGQQKIKMPADAAACEGVP
jgi:hypothetical protein